MADCGDLEGTSPSAHRYGGQPHAWIITGAVGHTTEHASQIRQFITTWDVDSGPPRSRQTCAEEQDELTDRIIACFAADVPCP